MNRCLQTILLTVSATIVTGQGPLGTARAETPGYESPSFYASVMSAGGISPQSTPPLPASPLAGGLPAAQGGAFMDAHGQPINLPASYCQPCAPAGGYSGGYPGVYGDPMAVDFGGYAADQSGPHYFDVSVDVVYLRPEKFFEDVGPFTSVGLGNVNDLRVDPTGQEEEYKPGWQIAARLDLGPLSVIEASYMGLYDFGFEEQIFSLVETNGVNPSALFSVFSNFGLDAALAAALVETEMATMHSISYESDLQSTEISYRRYWVGNNPRVSGTYLLGARYVRMTENFEFLGRSLAFGTATIDFDSENDLVGFQMGGDGWMSVRQGLRFGCEGKAGVYNNRFKFTTVETLGAPSPGAVNGEGNQVAFVGEGSASFVADILPSVSIRGGYRALYVTSLVKVGENINTSLFDAGAAVPALSTQGHAFYHGFHGGIEYVW